MKKSPDERDRYCKRIEEVKSMIGEESIVGDIV